MMQKTRKRKAKGILFSIALLLLLCLSFIHIAQLSEGVRRALTLCAGSIVPTVFPFMILSQLLQGSATAERVLSLLAHPFSRIFKLSPEGGFVFLVGNLFGFPMGARSIAHYYREGRISKEEAERLILFCGNASPFFLIGSVGLGMLGSARTGALLYAIQIVVSSLTGLIVSLFAKREAEASREMGISFHTRHFSLPAVIRDAVHQTLFICGYIVFFYAIGSVIMPYIKSTFRARFFLSLLEIGGATSYAAAIGGRYALSFCAFAASFSGISVFCQTLDCIEGTDLGIRAYLPTKLLCGTAAFFLALLCAR